MVVGSGVYCLLSLLFVVNLVCHLSDFLGFCQRRTVGQTSIAARPSKSNLVINGVEEQTETAHHTSHKIAAAASVDIDDTLLTRFSQSNFTELFLGTQYILKTMNLSTLSIGLLISLMGPTLGGAFTTPIPSSHHLAAASSTTRTSTQLQMGYSNNKKKQGRPRQGKDRSKRQERVGQLVRTELSQIIHTGMIKGMSDDILEDDLRKRISIVNADVSPDLRQARITVSIRKGMDETSTVTVDRRRAYSWLVQNTKPLRHTLAQRMSHIKTAPDLTFTQADVSAAVDVMYLIDKVSAGYKRDSVGSYGGDDDSLPRGMVEGMDFDDYDDDDDDWIEDDDDDDEDEEDHF